MFRFIGVLASVCVSSVAFAQEIDWERADADGYVVSSGTDTVVTARERALFREVTRGVDQYQRECTTDLCTGPIRPPHEHLVSACQVLREILNSRGGDVIGELPPISYAGVGLAGAVALHCEYGPGPDTHASLRAIEQTGGPTVHGADGS